MQSKINILGRTLYIKLVKGGVLVFMHGDEYEEKRKLLLWILRNVEEVKGRTLFQKIVFLGQERLGLPRLFKFKMHYYGPYSWDLTQMIEGLIAQGYITEHIKKSGDYITYVYTLSEKGREAAKGQTIKIVRHDMTLKYAAGALKSLAKIPLTTILEYVYRNFPENPA